MTFAFIGPDIWPLGGKGQGMHKLDSRSSQVLLSALEDLHCDADSATLPDRAVRSALKLVECDLLTFDLFSRTEKYEDTAWSNNPQLLNPTLMSTFGALLHQHPLVKIGLQNPNGEALKITDAISQADFERTDLYNMVYRQVHVDKQMGLTLLSEGDLIMTCAFTRKVTEFTDREKAIASLAAPHFVNAIKNGFAFGRLSTALDAGGSGVISLNANGKITFSSPFARVLLEKYFAGEHLAANLLPEALDRWHATASTRGVSSEYAPPTTPLRIRRLDGTLTIRLLDSPSTREEILLLEESKPLAPDSLRSLGLTVREAEILFWITEGKGNSEISILCDISIRTVHKHVEHIYVKLGVETRTAAMLRANEVNQWITP